MNRALLSFFFFAITFTASSQRLYFVYLQTEKQQPFFVKIGEKVNSSTASGYLILSRLKDSVYNFTLGFPGNQPMEQRFSCAINKKDHGYLVKNFGEKGWGLVDLQTQSIQMADNDSKKDVSFSNGPVNAFTELLAKAADDSALKHKIILPEEKAPEVVAKKEEIKNLSAIKTDTPKTGTASIPVIQATLKNEEIKKDTKQITDTIAKNIPPKEETKQTKPVVDATVKKEDIKKDTKQITDTVAKNIPPKEEPKQTKPLVDATVKKEDIKKDTKQITDTVAKNIPPKEEPKQTKLLVDATVKKEDEKKNTKQIDTVGKNILPKEEQKQTKPVDDTIAKIEEKKMPDKTVQEPPASEADSYTRTKIIRKSESSTTDGFGLLYIDVQPDGKQDTIRILIPNNSYNVQLINNKKDTVSASKDATTNKQETKIDAKPISPPPDTTASKAVSKNSCSQTASDDDFYKLRKKMAGGRSDASMIDEAKKVFKTKCFSTTQIKNLGTLFLGDGGKYNFFEVAYVHVSDIENFDSLQSELKDDYFINRFKTMQH